MQAAILPQNLPDESQELEATSSSSVDTSETTSDLDSSELTNHSSFHQCNNDNDDEDERHRHSVKDRKQVCFDERFNTYHENEQVAVSRDILWHNQQDYVQFRMVSAYIVGSVCETAACTTESNMASTFVSLVMKSYEACCCNDSDTETKVLTAAEQRTLLQIYEDTGGAVLVGLEKSIAREMARDIRDRKMEMTYAVAEIQDFGGTTILSTPSMALAMSVDLEIRQTCELLSRPSKLFARHMALLLRNALD